MVTLTKKNSFEEIDFTFDTIEQAKQAIFDAVKEDACIAGHESEVKQEIDSMNVGDTYGPQDWDAECDMVYELS